MVTADWPGFSCVCVCVCVCVRVWPAFFNVQRKFSRIVKQVMKVDQERKTGITGVPFGRTELSIRASCRKFRALASREGPVGLGTQGMSVKFHFHDF